MALPEQMPLSKRRTRGTRMYHLRNVYSLGVIAGFGLISLPIFYFSNFFKNCDALLVRFGRPNEYLEGRKYYFSKNLTQSSKDIAIRDFQIGVIGETYSDLTKHEHILKDDMPGFDDL